jgi:hypothetical protein
MLGSVVALWIEYRMPPYVDARIKAAVALLVWFGVFSVCGSDSWIFGGN